MGKKNKAGTNLGRQLIKDRFGHTPRRKVDNDTMLHTTELQDGYDWGRLNLSSVTEESSFNAFLRTAELAGTEFQAEKLNITFVNPKQRVGLLSKTQEQTMHQKHAEHRDQLKIPRRPKWTKEMSAEDLERAENEAFLNWRRDLALLQESEEILMTPYEKNLEFWRQLWRVVERSDVVVQIVDARNPLLFRSVDLERYVKEVDSNKMNMILVNKSDLLTLEQRQHWAQYFDCEGIRTAFYSATLVEEELKREAEAAKHADESPSSAMELKQLREAAEEIQQSLDVVEHALEAIESKMRTTSEPAVITEPKLPKLPTDKNSAHLLSRTELIEFLRHIYNGPRHTAQHVTIGMVGYPNVGKSSTINSLMTVKKVSVSATPGKTKRFQTLFLDKDILLCDCPGLVMPSFVLTKADMLLNGILPIDQMRDHVPAVNLLCERIPRHVLEDKYGIVIAKPLEGEDPNRPPFAEELLLAYGYNRGFMTSNGQPDQARSARYVLKDYVNGKLLFALGPPSVLQSEYHKFPERQRKPVEESQLPGQQQRAMRIDKSSSKELDQQFFTSKPSVAHVKGRTNFPHVRLANDGNLVAGEAPAKPWRNVKKERREKLRKKFSHLDEH
ncbi:PREDICTED: large subunit GTPase 1 homolog isoform X2 [Drosophila arizonae]|uniref:Large subunit GTPase 1 homolog n=1 Tax=Drosophila arizonae TaxID=7263 RepID=A0ABM1PTD6_DROAR|nr:PREDICTED: large subunit GTPase 1 homolog isoform X1 [Drosophila arizonae]XP_017870473.1 PREDICTED: large subunit GTPase 1 homolog isoform X2 [Drosophila arizonae]